MSSSGYVCQVMHKRIRPFSYRFSYQVFSLKLDIDALEQEAKGFRWLSLDRINLIRVNRKDYGARSDVGWRPWIDGLLAHYGLEQPAEKVELVCMPRILGFNFNPLAVWYAYNEKNELVALVGEVSNTFGQWHHYVYCQQGKPLGEGLRCQAQKVFHVSPFIGMDCDYRFRFSAPKERYRLVIEQTESGLSTLIATQSGFETPLTDDRLFKVAMTFPWQAIKVLGLIHWWAFKIWLKGGRFHKTPPHLSNSNHTHSKMKSCCD